jgi:asparagine synthase (glutamine-hydrolysing)
MCGIAGIYTNMHTNPSQVDLVKDMLSRIQHRGPDGQGIWSDQKVVLGHALLAIIGVGTGQQPLSNSTGTIWVTFNGEIYNHRELRLSLEKKGHIFRTNADTEVLVYLYEEYGTDLVHHLNGMFSFAIWDATQEKLLLARDRLGVKPLFLARSGDNFFFASELKALKASGIDLGGIDAQAIMNYLRFKHVGANRSIYSGVIKVPPAHIAVIHKNELRFERYWIPCPRYSNTNSHESIRALIRDATRIRLRSDVPLSISLSGGLDSSIVLYEAVKGGDYKGETFSVRYPGKSEDESTIAARFAKEMGVKHNIIDFAGLDIDFLPKLAEILDEPFGDYSAYPSYMLFKEQSKYSTVVLTGDGGDEAFGGYLRYSKSARYRKLLPLISLFNKVVPSVFDRYMPRKLSYLKEDNVAEACGLYREILSMEAKSTFVKMFNPSFKEEFENHEAYYGSGETVLDAQIENLESILDYLEYLPGDVLSKVDLTSMSSSIEARSPFLDYRIAELGLSLKSHNRVSAKQTKIALREAYKNKLPNYILHGKKRGFTVPESYWMNAEFKKFAQQLLLDNSKICRRFFRREALEKYLFSDYEAKGPVWNLVMLELWLSSVEK